MKTRILTALALFGALTLGVTNSHAATLVVTNLADSGPGTLRQAIADAESGDTITFGTSGTLTLATGLVITNSLTIAGPGAANLVVNGNHQPYSVFNLSGNTSITDNISGLTIENGVGGAGGGILNHSTLIVSNCVITANTTISGFNAGDGGLGGGVYNDGALTLIACTVMNNTTGNGANGATGADGNSGHVGGFPGGSGGSGGNGGGIYNVGTLTLIACTVTDNAAGNGGHGGTGGQGIINLSLDEGNGGSGGDGGFGGAGGGIANDGTLVLNNCTMHGNSSGNGGQGGDGGSTGFYDVDGHGGNGGRGGNGGFGGFGYNSVASSLFLTGCTISANRCGAGGAGGAGGHGFLVNERGSDGNPGVGGQGGGLVKYGSASSPTNTIVAGNSARFYPDTLGAVSGANNLIGVNPLLAPLGNYGGPTQTMPPLAGSPAIDAGLDSITNFLATDQRGFPRLAGAHVDIGAAEAGDAIPGANYTVVTTTSDFLNGLTSSGVSLRDAAVFATNGATITFTNTLSGQTILLTGGQLTLNQNVTIDASSLPAGITVSGNHSNRIFEVSAGTTVTLDSLTLTNGYAGSGGWGGAILVDSGGTLTLTNCTVSGNSATGAGGGIGNFFGVVAINNSTLSGNSAGGAGAIENDGGTVTINTSTLSGNSATGNGGAIDNDGATLLINNSTFSGNSASGGGGGIENYYGSATLNNSTLSANSAGGAAGLNNYGTLAMTNTLVAGNFAPFLPDLNLDSSGSFTGANNLTNGNPLLAPLGNYGGPTQTMPPLAGSPAIDAGADSVTSFLATDQRGFPRLSGAHVDIGAVEAQWAPAANPPLLTSPVRGSNGTFSFNFTSASVADFTVLTSTNVALPLGQWSILGAPMQYLPGQYQFTDLDATNYPQRFYMLVSP